MKYNPISLLFLTLIFTFFSCKKELGRINQNPNAVENPDPAYLLTGAIHQATQTYWSIGAGNTSSGNPTNLFIQYWASIQYTDKDRYIFSVNSFEPFWEELYSGTLINLQKVIDTARAEDNSNLEGVALTTRAWVFCLLTDVFGDIPYQESLNIGAHAHPEYDTQQSVYEGLLETLKDAEGLLDDNGNAVEGDIIYNGDIHAWKRFANSLRLRIALRVADQEPDLAETVLQELEQGGNNLISSNEESAKLIFDGAPNDNPLYEAFLTRDDYRISQSIVDRLTDLNDPRLPVYAAPTEDPTPETYVGVPNGLLVGDASLLGFTKTSKPGQFFLEEKGTAMIMSYSEVLFDLAEAVERDFIQGNAGDFYNQAITASLEQYTIDANEINDYLNQSAVQYDADHYKKSIGVQKWIALFGQGLEAFAEWRRLDYPQLQPAAAGVLNGAIPLRFIYPGREQSLNGSAYRKAVEHQGEDRLTTRLWFDLD